MIAKTTDFSIGRPRRPTANVNANAMAAAEPSAQ